MKLSRDTLARSFSRPSPSWVLRTSQRDDLVTPLKNKGILPGETSGPYPSSYEVLDPEVAACNHGIKDGAGSWWAMIPRLPPEPQINMALMFTEMAHPELCRLVHWTLRTGPDANRWWEDDTKRRHKHHRPPYWHSSQALAAFLQSIYRWGYWPGFERSSTGEASLRGIRFSGHQYELAELICHIIRAAGPEQSEADTLWDTLLDDNGVHQVGRDPHRHEVQLLDSFLGSLPDSLCGHIYTYPGMIEAQGRHEC